jgi:hypothetical protein
MALTPDVEALGEKLPQSKIWREKIRNFCSLFRSGRQVKLERRVSKFGVAEPLQ